MYQKRSNRWVIRIHYRKGGDNSWLYLVDSAAGWTNCFQYALQIPNEKLAILIATSAMRNFDLKKDLNYDDENEVIFDTLEIHEIKLRYVNPKLFWETQGREQLYAYERFLNKNKTAKQKLEDVWNTSEIERGKGVTFEQFFRRITQYNWNVEDAISKPLMIKKRSPKEGHQLREELRKIYESRAIRIGKGVTFDLASRRYTIKDWDMREAIQTPKRGKKNG